MEIQRRMEQRIGTILHGALGDYYEQLCAIRAVRRAMPGTRWVGFYKDEQEFRLLRHFELDMLDEVHPAAAVADVPVDRFYQYQVRDIELQQDIISRLPDQVRNKFDQSVNLKPWHEIRRHDFSKSPMALGLSDLGKEFLPICNRLNGIDDELFKNKLTIGYLWRHRGKGADAVKPIFQRSVEWILQTKSELFSRLVTEHNAHVIVAGMKRVQHDEETRRILDTYGFLQGSYKGKYTEHALDIPAANVTYLKGLGFAAEMEIMDRCDLLMMMPSGFSEALWMRRRTPVVLLDPPPVYMAKIFWNRMPLFDNYAARYAWYNTVTPHTADNVVRFLTKENLLMRREKGWNL